MPQRQRHSLFRSTAGALAARTGDEMSGPAVLLLGAASTGSVATGAALLAGITVTAALGGPLVGAALDRASRPGRLLAAALVGYAAGLAVVAAALGRLPLPLVVGAALATGLLGPALSGGWTAQLPRVVPAERLARASALDAMTFGGASLLGPGAAGLAAALLGAPAAVAGAVALIAVAVPVAWALPGRSATAARAPLASDLRAGVRAVLGNAPLRRVTAATVVSIAGSGMFVVCLPGLGDRFLGGQAHGALLLSLMAVCSLAANLLLTRAAPSPRPDTVVLVCLLVQAAGMGAAALAGSALGLVAAATLVGAAEGPQLTALFRVRHRESPAHLRAQVFTTGASLKISAFALGAAAAGPLAEHAPVACLAVAAVLQVGAATALLRG
ncbi:MFS transporter [Nocardiopsis sp. NRRL B-16309]|uniref:MFS transporter n=1 Tax=Nocardiopsis sp. NRRL B-16309 TaxID=1519494 RepID=UPI0006AFC361|nr:MFS transporter [Nocardiopsis sp. NRRL B-16309]KOX15710.1 integral membrane protein [Nocardiopsis sp. NRRL B-16309]